jgi:hypothetical protein
MDAVPKLRRLVAVATAAGGRDVRFENRRNGIGASSNLVGAMTIGAGGSREVAFLKDSLSMDTLLKERHGPRPCDPFLSDDLRIRMAPGAGLVYL